ncbi:hypothetical protein AB0L82_00050 [Nocardia sp. NPDC052001]|uniref:hypothetical protein n=1 Tax=unclassified Nocardia TaxID=2637762 RepID=UPI00341538E5
MKKLGTAMLIGAAATAIIGSGAGMASAEAPVVSASPVVAPGEPDPTGTTGSSSLLPKLLETLTGSLGSKPATDPAK